MAFYPIRSDWFSKPPIGTPLRTDGHWSVQGLIGAMIYNEAAGQVALNLVTGQNTLCHNAYESTILVYGAGGAQVFYGDGIALGWHESGRYIYIALDGYFPTLTTVSGFRRSTLATQVLWMGNADNTSYIYSHTEEVTYAVVTISGYGSAYPPALRENIDFCAISVDASNINAYFNDARYTYANTLADTLTSIRFGNRQRFYVDSRPPWPRYYDLAYDRVLTQEQVMSLRLNPYQIFEPRITLKDVNIQYPILSWIGV